MGASGRGYFAIGIMGGKTPSNLGTLWREAHSFGAAFIFTIGRRYPRQATDTTHAWKSLPLFEHTTLADFLDARPRDCLLVGIELAPQARPLSSYTHFERAIYLLGAEDNGLSTTALATCQHVVQIPGRYCHNVAVAGAIVMADRMMKAERAERYHTLAA